MKVKDWLVVAPLIIIGVIVGIVLLPFLLLYGIVNYIQYGEPEKFYDGGKWSRFKVNGGYCWIKTNADTAEGKRKWW